MNINLNLYKYFYEVAKYNSFTKASEKLLISQPALSYSIKTLENQLGIKLFNRINNKIILTEDGKIIYEKLTEIFKEFDEIGKVASSSFEGTIKVGARIGCVNKILTPKVNEFNIIYPNIKIKLIVRDKKELEDLLNNNQIDIVIDDNKYCVNSEKICNIALKENISTYLVASAKYKDIFDNIKIDKKYFKNNKLLLVLGNGYGQELYKELGQKQNEKLINCSTTQMLLGKLDSEPIIGHVAKVLIKKELDNGSLVIVNTNFDLPNTTNYASYFKDKEDLKLKAFLNIMKEEN